MRRMLGGALGLVWMWGCGAGGLPAEALQHNGAGADLLARGRLDDAEARFRLALEYHPRFAEPRANLGLVALRRGRLRQAERHLRAAVRLNEDFAAAWGNLGLTLERQKEPGRARRAYQRALGVNPGLTAARRNLARLELSRGRFRQARAHFLRLVQLVPADARAEALLAYCELRMGRIGAAERRADRVLEREPDAPAARVVRGAARARRGAFEAAVEDFEAASGDPDVGRHARVRWAAVRVIQGKLGRSRELLRPLLEQDPLDPAARLVAGHGALRAGRAAEARRHLRVVVRVRPGSTRARALLKQASCAAHEPNACAGGASR
jgi:Tfp pilus assembly protein PilF